VADFLPEEKGKKIWGEKGKREKAKREKFRVMIKS